MENGVFDTTVGIDKELLTRLVVAAVPAAIAGSTGATFAQAADRAYAVASLLYNKIVNEKGEIPSGS